MGGVGVRWCRGMRGSREIAICSTRFWIGVKIRDTVRVVSTLKLKPLSTRTEIDGTQASIISALTEAPTSAYFVLNTYLDPDEIIIL